MTECGLCIEIFECENNIFRCNACKYENCISCHKTYLLGSTQDPHCISCRAVIPYELFVKKFNIDNWISKKYKPHRKNILWEREQSLFPETVSRITLKKKEDILLAKKRELKKQIDEITNQIYLLNNKEKSTVLNFKFTYACPMENCKGFLDADFHCAICTSNICNKCYVKINDEYADLHECDPELVETFETIKKEAKPCPTCGEFISKISGCDQMFCVKCGTAFSWKTGLVEKGIIHNPHAHTFFQNNPGAQQNYLNNQNQNNGDCRPPIPPFAYFKQDCFYDKNNPYLPNYEESVENCRIIAEMHRRISEFRQYDRNRLLRYNQAHENNQSGNLDLRIKFINNLITEKLFKQTLHSRDKKIYFNKIIFQTFVYTFEIAEYILWSIADITTDAVHIKGYQITPIDIKRKLISDNMNLLRQLIIDTNENFNIITCEFGYKSQYSLNPDFSHHYISI